MNKYHNQTAVVDGKRFDSRKEARRYQELRLLERSGAISDLKTQVPFLLIPAQKDDAGKTIERAVMYYADFTYNEGGQYVVEDAKGCRTDVYKIKRKLMLSVYGIKIRET